MAIRKRYFLILLLLAIALPIIVNKYNIGGAHPETAPPGKPLSIKTKFLSLGAALLQNHTPTRNFNIYFVGFHPMKNDPSHQMETHHYCQQVNEDFAQCVLFDANTSQANLTGIEYIISERIYETLPVFERPYWHPHNYEILSGQLNAIGLPKTLEKLLLRDKMNTYGKTWHVWMANTVDEKGDFLPFSEPMLGWSFNHDGEINEQLLTKFFSNFNIEVEKKRQQRVNLKKMAKEQTGVDAIQVPAPPKIADEELEE